MVLMEWDYTDINTDIFMNKILEWQSCQPGSNTHAHQLPLLRCEVEIIFRVTVNKAKVILDWILCFTKEKSVHISIHDVSVGGIVLRT